MAVSIQIVILGFNTAEVDVLHCTVAHLRRPQCVQYNPYTELKQY
jgi:hypothetical protein